MAEIASTINGLTPITGCDLGETRAALETRLAELVTTIARLERRERRLLRNLAALEVAIAAMRRTTREGKRA